MSFCHTWEMFKCWIWEREIFRGKSVLKILKTCSNNRHFSSAMLHVLSSHYVTDRAVINFTLCCLTVSISVMVLFGVNPLIISYCKAKIDRGSALGSTERKRIEVLLSVQLVLSANSQVDLLTKIGRYMKSKVY